MPLVGPRPLRGILFSVAREFLAARVPGGLVAVQRQLGNAELADYLHQPFDVQQFYDPAPALAIGLATARAMGVPQLAFVRAGARWAATKDLRDPRRPRVAAPFGPELAISRLAAMATHAFDINPITIQRVSSTHVRAMARGIPNQLADWFAAIVEGAVPATIEKGSVTKAEVQTRAPIRNGDEVTLIFEIRWS